MSILASIVFLGTACGFAYKSTVTAFDFCNTPLSELPKLERQAASFLVTVAGFASMIILFRLAVIK